MGYVLSSFPNGFAGSISRSLDDVVISMANKSGETLGFGVPVALNPAGNGVVPFDGNTHTAENFLGVTVRNPSKTPDTYGSKVGSYAANELADVLVRGHITVKMTGASSAKAGAAVAVNKSTGAFTVGSGDTVVQLTSAHLARPVDDYGMAEIVLNVRNVF